MIVATKQIKDIWAYGPNGLPNDNKNGKERKNAGENGKAEKNADEENKNRTVDEIILELKETYNQRGEAAKSIMEIFQSWFLIPWIIFFLVNALSVSNILHPWSTTSHNLPQIYLLLYNLYHVLLLLIAYACGFVMDSYHHQFYTEMKKKLPETDLLRITEEDNFNFVPRLLGKRIHLNSAVYVIVLILGTFLSIFGRLFPH